MSAQGRLQESLAKFIESVFPNFDFMAMYSGVINAAGPNPNTFDFTPDSKLLAGLQSVQMFTGVPGVTITVDTSQSPRCFLGFAGGDPTQPYLALWAIPGLSTYLMKAEESITLEINTDGIPGAQEILSGQNIQLNPNTTIPSVVPGSLPVARLGDIVIGTAGAMPIMGNIGSGSSTVTSG